MALPVPSPKLPLAEPMKILSIFTRLLPALMLASGFSVLLSAEGAKADPQVDVKVFTGFTFSGGGKPYNGFVGELKLPAILTGFSFHPFSLPSFGADFSGVFSISSGGQHVF